MKLITRSALMLAASVVVVAPAAATTVISFSQTSTAPSISATANAANTATTLQGSGIAVNISNMDGNSTSVDGFFQLSANSSGAAVLFNGNVLQNFSGSFAVTANADGTGDQYLTGSFTNMALLGGASNGNGATLSTSNNQVSFTSTTMNDLVGATDRTMNLGLANIPNNAQGNGFALCGASGSGTVCSFGSSSVIGNFSATLAQTPSVPEPASWAMMVGGFGLLGGALRRKRQVSAVTFG